MNNFCLHSNCKYIELENNNYQGRCNDCGLDFTSSFCGIIHDCPRCNKKCKTSCSACGCGNCLECGYRFFCSPPIQINQILAYNITTNINFEAINREIFRIES